MDQREYQQRIEACLPALYRVARSVLSNEHDCADAVQEAIFQGWINRRQLRDPSNFKTWITRVTINECRNLQRRAQKQKWAVEASIQEMRQGANESLNIELEAALSSLPDKYRLPLVLHYIEEYPTKTIAGLMEIPEGRLRERMRTARKLLGRMLKYESEG